MNAKPNNVVILSHQLFFSKSDFYVRVNSRKYYDYGNNLYDKVYNHFFAGDIGAFPLTPYSFYNNVDNFIFYGFEVGNEKNHKAILIEMNNDIKVNFVDIKSRVIEPKEKYLKYKVQFYQFPTVILSYVKRNFIYVLAILGFTVAFCLFKERYKATFTICFSN